MDDDVEHAPLAPSSAFQWVYCSMSPRAQKQYPEIENEDAAQGDASHWVGSSTLDSYQPHSQVLTTAGMIGWEAPNGVIINQEMADGAELYVNDILHIAQKYALMRHLQVEKRVKISLVHEDNWGTPDCWVYDAKNNTLYVWDYKFGHRFVEVFENWQLLDYIIGIVEQLKIIECDIVMRIVQPRTYGKSGPIREWRIKASQLTEYICRLVAAANEAMGDNPTFTTGDHCRDCNARHACPGAQEAAMRSIDISKMKSPLVDLPPAAMGLELTMLKRAEKAIKARMTGIEIQVEMLVKTGTIVPGWGLDTKYGRRAWNKPFDEVVAVGDLLGVELRKNETCTPTQAISKGIDETVINAYSTRKASVQLVQDDGTRAKHVFTQEDKKQ